MSCFILAFLLIVNFKVIDGKKKRGKGAIFKKANHHHLNKTSHAHSIKPTKSVEGKGSDSIRPSKSVVIQASAAYDPKHSDKH